MGFSSGYEKVQRELGQTDFFDDSFNDHDYVRSPEGRILIPGKLSKTLRDALFKREVDEIQNSQGENPEHIPVENDVLDETKPKSATSKAQIRPFRRCVRVFRPDDIQSLKGIAKNSQSEVKRRIEGAIKSAEAHDGYRQIPSFKSTRSVLSDLKKEFANFEQVIEHLSCEFTLSDASKPESFSIRPILLDGPPGVGKTAFAQRLAKGLRLPYRKISAGGMQHAFTLTGTATHWGNSQTGEVFNMVGRSESATGVFLVDEVDKLSDRQDTAILPALLDLLEPESARNYTEESLGLSFDASRLIVLLTSNSVRDLDPALKSRCRIFEIDYPSAAQKVHIANREFAKLNSGLLKSRRLEIDSEAVAKLAELDIDVRTLVTAVNSGFSFALKGNQKVVSPIVAGKKQRRKNVGFVWEKDD